MQDNMDMDEYEFAKFEAIQKTSEKEYLNAMLSSLNMHTVLLNKIFFAVATILLIGVFFLVKNIAA